jgi:hypothetical protein
MTVATTALSAISTLAAAVAAFYAARAVREARAARADDAFHRELNRLHDILELIGNVAVAARAEKWTQELAVAQLHLGAVLVDRPDLRACRKLVEAEAEFAFEDYLDAQNEVAKKIDQHRAVRRRATPAEAPATVGR